MRYAPLGLGLIGLLVTMAIAVYLLELNLSSFTGARSESGTDVKYGNVIEEVDMLKQEIERTHGIE